MKAGPGTLVCSMCKGPKRTLESKVCGKAACRTHGWRQMTHRIVEMNRRKRGELIAPHVTCPECAADIPVPDEGKMVCPRCRLEVA